MWALPSPVSAGSAAWLDAAGAGVAGAEPQLPLLSPLVADLGETHALGFDLFASAAPSVATPPAAASSASSFGIDLAPRIAAGDVASQGVGSWMLKQQQLNVPRAWVDVAPGLDDFNLDFKLEDARASAEAAVAGDNSCWSKQEPQQLLPCSSPPQLHQPDVASPLVVAPAPAPGVATRPRRPGRVQVPPPTSATKLVAAVAAAPALPPAATSASALTAIQQALKKKRGRKSKQEMALLPPKKPPRGTVYTAEYRRRVVEMYRERRTRRFKNRAKYDCRRRFAVTRVRVGGRFVSKSEEAQLKQQLAPEPEASTVDEDDVEDDEEEEEEDGSEAMDTAAADAVAEAAALVVSEESSCRSTPPQHLTPEVEEEQWGGLDKRLAAVPLSPSLQQLLDNGSMDTFLF